MMVTRNEQLKALISPVVEALGCELWGLEYFSQDGRATLRLYIEKSMAKSSVDRKGEITIEDCEKVSRQVSSVLDVEDPIQGRYALEVSSPGIDRPLYTLEQFAKYVGERVNVRLRASFEGRRKFSGLLNGVEDDNVMVVVDEHEYLLPIDAIEKANIVPRF